MSTVAPETESVTDLLDQDFWLDFSHTAANSAPPPPALPPPRPFQGVKECSDIDFWCDPTMDDSHLNEHLCPLEKNSCCHGQGASSDAQQVLGMGLSGQDCHVDFGNPYLYVLGAVYIAKNCLSLTNVRTQGPVEVQVEVLQLRLAHTSARFLLRALIIWISGAQIPRSVSSEASCTHISHAECAIMPWEEIFAAGKLSRLVHTVCTLSISL